MNNDNNETYIIDLDKVQTVSDCALLLKAILGSVFGSEEISVNKSSPYYEALKHLEKENTDGNNFIVQDQRR